MLPTILVLLLVVLMFVYFYIENNWIQTEECKIPVRGLPKGLKELRILHLSDLHIPCNNSSLNNILKKIKKTKPDLILITGDLIDAVKDPSQCDFDNFIHKTGKTAPCYAIPGNHEAMFGDYALWEYYLTKNRVKTLRNSCTVFEYNGERLAIAGIDHGYKYEPDIIKGIEQAEGLPFIVLDHQPQNFRLFKDKKFDISPDLVLSGHAHGGQVRLPFIGGLFAPGQGILPKYTYGLYTFDKVKTKMYVSRGLGRSTTPFRINNRPHLPLLILENEE